MGKRVYRDITVRGVTYPDANAAAAALGVSAEAVRIAIRKGTAHRIGTRAVGSEPMPVLVNGQIFESARSAAAQLGLKPSTIYRAINEGRAHRLTGIRRYNGGRSKPVTLGNLCFSSMEQANRALGFRQGYVSLALRRGSKAAKQRILAAAMAYAAAHPEQVNRRAA